MVKLNRVVAIGVQLDKISHALYIEKQFFQIRLESRFTPGDTYAVQYATALLKKGVDFFQRNVWKLGCPCDKRTIMTERTFKLAVADK